MQINFGQPVDNKTILWMDGPEKMDTQDILGILSDGLDVIRLTLVAELSRRGMPTPAERPTPN